MAFSFATLVITIPATIITLIWLGSLSNYGNTGGLTTYFAVYL